MLLINRQNKSITRYYFRLTVEIIVLRILKKKYCGFIRYIHVVLSIYTDIFWGNIHR